jgi:hypothetical protein
MAERKYSVSEIDRMRRAVALMMIGPCRNGAEVEDRLRTYMLNGTDPEELDEAAKPHIEAEEIRVKAFVEKFKPGGVRMVNRLGM